MLKNKKIIFKLNIIILIVSLIFPSTYIPSIAYSSDYSLSNETIVLDGENDGEVKINLVTTAGGTFYALEADWSLSETASTTYLTLSNLEAAENVSASENNPTTGSIVWADSTFTGFDVEAAGTIWTATYIVDKDTPAGTYTINLDIETITGGTAGNDSDENIQLTSTITVEREDEQTVIEPEISGYEDSYEYIGSSIKPNITVNIKGTTTSLTEGIDYTVIYGTNTDLGTGTITINPVSTSEYTFTETSVNFIITAKELTNENVTVPNTITITGSDLSPETIVTVNNVTLIEDTDYMVSYSNQKGAVGEYVTVTVTGQGNYSGTVTKTVLIEAKPERNIETIENKELRYGDTDENTEESDYEITYTSSNEDVVTINHEFKDNYNSNTIIAKGIGSAVITVTHAETAEYAETTTTFEVTVTKAELTITDVIVSDREYDASADAEVIDIDFSGIINNDTLTLGTDYTVEAKFALADSSVGENKEVIVTVTLLGDIANKYSLKDDTYTTTATISASKIEENNVEIESSDYTYNGSAIKPILKVTVNGIPVYENRGYTVECKDNINAGIATVTITGINNYIGTVEKTFIINKKEITPIISDIDDVIYTGKAQEPKLTVTADNITLKENTDYIVVYSDNINAGTGTATISKMDDSNYTFDSVDKEFEIKPYTITEGDISLEYTTVRYDGNSKKPAVTVSVNGEDILDTNYSVSYSNNTEVGTATVTVTAVGSNYTGTVEKTFTIAAKEVLIISGIQDNQSITYTGEDVALEGILEVSDNDNGITAKDLVTTWYDSEDKEISQPTDVGSYVVVYSYSDVDYVGSLSINFEIIKAISLKPIVSGLTGIEGNDLSTVEVSTIGLTWVNENETLLAGNNTYLAYYTKNNDTKNYTTETFEIMVYGNTHIDITTEVSGKGGTISGSISNVLEGTTKNIIFIPDEGYEIDTVTVNGNIINVENNTLSLQAETKNLEVVVTYKIIKYNITINANNVETNPSGSIYVDYNSSKSITITPNTGYELTSVVVNGIEMIDNLESGVLTLSNIITDLNIVATAEKIIYENKEDLNVDESSKDNSYKDLDKEESYNSTKTTSDSVATGDNISNYVILLITAILGILVIIIGKRKN